MSTSREEVCPDTRESQPTQEVLGDSAVGCEAAYQSQATRLTIRQPTDNSLATGNGSEKEATREREPCLPQASTDDQFKSFLPRPQADAGRVVSRSSSWSEERPVSSADVTQLQWLSTSQAAFSRDTVSTA